jgi:hypothetical protein
LSVKTFLEDGLAPRRRLSAALNHISTASRALSASFFSLLMTKSAANAMTSSTSTLKASSYSVVSEPFEGL